MANQSGALAFIYSGGPNNSSPSGSLGGQVSTTEAKYIVSQNADGATISGLSIVHAARNPIGQGYLSYTASSHSLTWSNPMGVHHTVVLYGDGPIAVGSTVTGYLRLIVDYDQLPVSDVTEYYTISSAVGTLFGSPNATDLAVGSTEYRALYIKNESQLAAINVSITVLDLAAESTMSIGSTFLPLSVYSTPKDEWLGSHMANLITGLSMYSTSMSGQFQREKLHATNLAGYPKFKYYASTGAQNSDGLTTDVEYEIANVYDSTGVLSAVEWSQSLTWSEILPGKMVSFWTRRQMPASPVIPTVEEVAFDLVFTLTT